MKYEVFYQLKSDIDSSGIREKHDFDDGPYKIINCEDKVIAKLTKPRQMSSRQEGLFILNVNPRHIKTAVYANDITKKLNLRRSITLIQNLDTVILYYDLQKHAGTIAVWK